MPRVYLSTIKDVAAYLKGSRNGHGYTSLREKYRWASGVAKGSSDRIPEEWKPSTQRIDALMGLADTAG